MDVALQDRWMVFVNAVMNFMFHKMWGISRLAGELLASQEGLCSIGVVGTWLEASTDFERHLRSLFNFVKFIFTLHYSLDQPRGLVVRVSDY